MASKVTSGEGGEPHSSSTTLPLITERRSLVSPVPVPDKQSSVAVRGQVRKWKAALDERVVRIREQEMDKPPEMVAALLSHVLKQELMAVFIRALHRKDRHSWMFLVEALSQINEYHDLLITGTELYHYAERVCRYLEVSGDQPGDLQITTAIRAFFPPRTDGAKSKKRFDCYNLLDSALPVKSTPASKAAPARLQPVRSPFVPEGRNLFALDVMDENVPAGLSLGDLNTVMADVALQIATREAIWHACLGTTALAINVDLSCEFGADTKTPSLGPSPRRPLKKSKKTSTVCRDLPSKEADAGVRMTGREAVEHFAKCHHLGKIDSLFFNIAPGRHFQPYTLIEVPEDKANPEHYVFGTFGVLHVYADKTSECMSLAAWQREAVLYTAASKIPFFKYYLLRKTLHRWRTNVRYAQFAAVRHQVATRLLTAMPCYGAALLQISRLCREILRLNLLPVDTQKSFRLLELENELHNSYVYDRRILQRFFRYIRIVLDTTFEELDKKLRSCEEEISPNKAFSASESLYEQKAKQQRKQKNLQKVKREMCYFETFVSVAKQMILSHLVSVARHSISAFVNSLKSSTVESSRDAFLRAAFVFEPSTGALLLDPSAATFLAVLVDQFDKLPIILTEYASLIAGSDPTGWPSYQQLEEPTRLETLFADRHVTASVSVRLTERATTSDSFAANSTDWKVPRAASGGQQKSLSAENLTEKLHRDGEYQTMVEVYQLLVKSTLDDVNDYCEKNSWLSDIQHFCSNWNLPAQVAQFKDAPAFAIEQKLSEFNQWSERIRSCESMYITDSGLLAVDCSTFHDDLLPSIDVISQQTYEFLAAESVNRAREFCDEMRQSLQKMKLRPEPLEEFAMFAHHVQLSRRNVATYQQRVEYIKSLFEIVHSGYHYTSDGDEKLETLVSSLWEDFMVQLQDAVEYVNVHTPLIMQTLDEKMQKLELEARAICDLATSGKFLDARENPTAILIDMMRLRDKFYEIQKEVEDVSQWKESITDEPYDVRFLTEMTLRMDVRQELWKYFEVSTLTVKEWKSTVFTKFNVKKATDKVQEWMLAARSFRDRVMEGDEVLTSWKQQLENFYQHLPILLKLSDKALKACHWKQIFHGMGLEYDAGFAYRVEDLIALDLAGHVRLIESILSAAIEAYDVEHRFDKIRSFWSEQNFKLARHIPDGARKAETLGVSSVTSSHGPSLVDGRYRSNRTSVGASKAPNLSRDNLYIVTDVPQLRYLLEDSRVSLQTILTSPHLAELCAEARSLDVVLGQIDELVDLWYTCQNQWLFLLRIFDEPEMCQKLSDKQFEQFTSIHTKFLEFVRSVVGDPKVLSMAHKSRGEKGYRLHQGDRLRSLLTSLKQTMAELLQGFTDLLDDTRSQFPRLYFISDDELIEILASPKSIRHLLPVVRKCFPGIINLGFELPQSKGTSQHHSVQNSAAINVAADKMDLTRLFGPLGEQLVLCSGVQSRCSATRWLAAVEQYMKTTIQLALETCVQTRLDDDCKAPRQLLDELKSRGTKDAEKSGATPFMLHSHWMLQFPSQCVLMTEAIMWERGVQKAVDAADRDELKMQCRVVSDRLNQYVLVQHGNASTSASDDSSGCSARLQCLLGNLITQSLYHRDAIQRLLLRPVISNTDFNWLSTLRYRMEIHTVLNVRPDSATNLGSHVTSNNDSNDLTPTVMHAAVHPHERGNDVGDGRRESTVVSTGYQFGRCLASQMGRSFPYDCEFYGAHQRLVFTPLTERAYLSLTLALKSFQSGVLVGPSGYGKSETISDLALAFGRHLVTIHCNSDLSLSLVNRYLVGMIQSGSWGLFDNGTNLPTGLLSVLGQHLDHLNQTLKVLDITVNNQYGIRGQPRPDQKGAMKCGERIRRNSLTTLHSLPISSETVSHSATRRPGLDRQMTVPHGFNEEGLVTYFEDPWVTERERRNSIEKEIRIEESDMYRSLRPMKPPPLLYEHVTLHRRPKTDFKQWLSQRSLYRPTYIGNVLFNGSLMKANANYGCFMTFNDTAAFAAIPDNLKATLRSFAVVEHDTKMITEVMLYRTGFTQHQSLATKLDAFFRLLHTQLPTTNNYRFGLRTIVTVLRLAGTKLHHSNIHSKAGLPAMVVAGPGSAVHRSDNGSETDSVTDDSQSIVSGCSGSSSTSSTVSSFLATSDIRAGEEAIVVECLLSLLETRMLTTVDAALLCSIARDVFPTSVRVRTANDRAVKQTSSAITDAVVDQLRGSGLQPDDSIVGKILQLHSCLSSRHSGVILVGPAGSGKTTCYRTLAKAVSSLSGARRSQRQQQQQLLTDIEGTVVNGAESDHHSGSSLTLSPRSQESSSSLDELRKSGHSSNFATRTKLHLNFQKVDVDVLYPNIFTTPELFGYYDNAVWQTGLLIAAVKKASQQAESTTTFANDASIQNPAEDSRRSVAKWIVLNGEINPTWIDGVNALLDDPHEFRSSNGEVVKLHESTTIMFETTELNCLSPATISRCALVHCASDTVSWKSLVGSWCLSAHERWIIGFSSIQSLRELMTSTFDRTIEFLQVKRSEVRSRLYEDCVSDSLNATFGLLQVSLFLSLFTALLDSYYSHKRQILEPVATSPDCQQASSVVETVGITGRAGSASSVASGCATAVVPNTSDANLLKQMFAFAYIWGFSTSLTDRFLSQFDTFARNLLATVVPFVSFADDSSVFDWFLDCKRGTSMLWNERPTEKSRLPSATNYVAVPELERYAYWVDLLLNSHQPVLITGDSGVGKTSLIENLVQKKHTFTKLTMSAQVGSRCFHEFFESGITTSSDAAKEKTKLRKLYFIDDLNCAKACTEIKGCQPNIEIVRQLLSERVILDHRRQRLVPILDVPILAAATSPGIPGTGYGYVSHRLSARALRQFTVVNVHTPSEQALKSVYGRMTQLWLDKFPTQLLDQRSELSEAVVGATLDIYGQIRSQISATPSQAHCLFSLHDVAHVFEGMLLMSAPRGAVVSRAVGAQTACTIVRLWCHEMSRTFADRLVAADDKQWFSSQLQLAVIKYFCTGMKTDSDDPNLGEIPSQASATATASEDLASSTLPSSAVEVTPVEPSTVTSGIGESSQTDSLSMDTTDLPQLSTVQESSQIAVDAQQPLLTRTVSSSSAPRSGSGAGGGRSSACTDSVNSRPSLLTRMASRAGMDGKTDVGHSFPLLLSQILNNPQENLADIVFSKFIMSSQGSDQAVYKGYVETDLRKLTGVLSDFLGKYAEQPNLVLFEQAVRHLARLTRILALPGGHALLLASGRATGRTTLVKLAAHLANYKLFEPMAVFRNEDGSPLSIFLDQLKQASMSAGAKGRPTILLLHEDLGDECLQAACAFFKDGNFPGLYSSDEIQAIVGQGNPGQATEHVRNERSEAAFRKYLQRVKQFLHLVVCLRYSVDDDSLFTKVSRWPALFTQCCFCDLYVPWSREVYFNVARHWLSNEQSTASSNVPWYAPQKSRQKLQVAEAMAYIHCSAEAAIVGRYHNDSVYKPLLISPRTFSDFVQLFKSLACCIHQRESQIVEKFEMGVRRMKEAEESISASRQQMALLSAKHTTLVEKVSLLEAAIEQKKSDFAEAQEMCRIEEERIGSLASSMEQIRSSSSLKMEETDPMYKSSLDALMALDQRALEELRSYRVPPEGVHMVMSAVCMLFSVPMSSWEDARLMLMRDNFFLDLVYFDKSQMSPEVVELLALYCTHPLFKPDAMMLVSVAAAHVCSWLRAVNSYACTRNNLKPLMTKLQDTEAEMKRSQVMLGKKHMEALLIKSALETDIAAHREASQQAKELNRQLQVMEKSMSEATSLVDQLSAYHLEWKSRAKISRALLKSTIPDALLAAACIVYHSALDQPSRDLLLADWTARCESGSFRAESFSSESGISVDSKPAVGFSGISLIVPSENFSLAAVLGVTGSVASWEIAGRPGDASSCFNGLLLWTFLFHDSDCRPWPLIVDPDNQAEPWIVTILQEAQKSTTSATNVDTDDTQFVDDKSEDKSVEKKFNLCVVAADDINFEQILCDSLTQGDILLVTHLGRTLPSLQLFKHIIHKQFKTDDSGNSCVQVGENVFTIHMNFRLLLSTNLPLHLEELVIPGTFVIDMTLGEEAIHSSLLHQILLLERPECESQKRSLKHDFVHLDKELEHQRDLVLSAVQSSESCILEDKQLSSVVDECQSNIDRQMSMLEELRYMQDHLYVKQAPYLSVAANGERIYGIVRKLYRLNPIYYISLDTFTDVFARAIRARDRGQSWTGLPEARAQELIDATTGAIYKHTSTTMSESHATLLALLFAFERLRTTDRLADEILPLLSRGIIPAATPAESSVSTSSSPPHWMSNEVWQGCVCLESSVAVFRGLCDSLIKYSCEWQEHFKHPFNLLSTMPGTWIQSLTPLQRCLLWRTCMPNRAYEICQPLTVHALGGVIEKRSVYDVHQVFAQSSCNVPIVFLLPEGQRDRPSEDVIDGIAGHCFGNPANDVQQLAKDVGMEGRVRTFAFGVNAEQQMSEIRQTMSDSMQSGYWLILQNVHLAESWDTEMLQLLRAVIVTRTGTPGKQTGNKSPEESPTGSIHKDFRLWITTKLSKTSVLPVLLVENALKVACDMPHNLCDLLRRTYMATERLCGTPAKTGPRTVRKQPDNGREHALLVFIHSLLVYNSSIQYAGECWCSTGDLLASVDQLQASGCDLHCGADSADIIASIYAGSCTSSRCAATVQSLARTLLSVLPTIGDEAEATSRPVDISSLARQLLSGCGNECLVQRIDKLTEPSMTILSIPHDAQQNYMSSLSRNLLQNLAQVEDDTTVADLSLEGLYSVAVHAVSKIQSSLKSMPLFPPLNSNQPASTLSIFLHSELQMLQTHADMISAIADHLQTVINDMSAMSPPASTFLQELVSKRQSSKLSIASGDVDVSMSWLEWAECIPDKAAAVVKCFEARDGMLVVSIGSLLRPERFLDAILRHMTRQQFKNLTASTLRIEPVNASQPGSDKGGVCIEGLWLNNAFWDMAKSAVCAFDTRQQTSAAVSSNPGRYRMPLVQLRLTEFAERRSSRLKSARTGNHLFRCPLLSGSGETVGSLDVPCVDRVETCIERGVYLAV